MARYALALADFNRLLSAAQFRERQVWDLPEDEIAGVTIRQGGGIPSSEKAGIVVSGRVRCD
jgi:hypothetical protein